MNKQDVVQLKVAWMAVKSAERSLQEARGIIERLLMKYDELAAELLKEYDETYKNEQGGNVENNRVSGADVLMKNAHPCQGCHYYHPEDQKRYCHAPLDYVLTCEEYRVPCKVSRPIDRRDEDEDEAEKAT